jgi:uncharacterized protein (TIGR03089 family)
MPDDALRRALAKEPGRPLITQYDDSTGERVELSVATVENWVAKTANLLQESGVEPGATAAVLLPAHWQTAVILLGCWRAGVAVTYSALTCSAAGDDYQTRGAAGGHGEPAVAFVAANRAEEVLDSGAEEIWALSLAPMAAPLREVPKGASDYAVEVRGQADRFTPYAPVDAAGPGLTVEGLSLAGLVDQGRVKAAELGLEPGGRLLVSTEESPVGWLLAPLVTDASLVLLRNPAPAGIERIVSTERVTTRYPSPL